MRWSVIPLLLVPALAHAGNDDGILLGNDAALAAGAVVATTADGSALWYNPSGLGSVSRDSLDLSASAFVLRAYRFPGILSFATGEESSGRVLEIVSVPSALTLVRKVGHDTRVGLGVFVPQSFDLTLRARIEAPGAAYDSTWILTDAGTDADYHVGAGIGHRVAPGLWVGASLFGVYRSASGFAQFWGGFEQDGQTVAFLGSTSLTSFEIVSLEAGAGVQWQASRWVRLGLAVRSPGVEILESYRFQALTGAAELTEDGSAAIALDSTEDDALEARVGLVSPVRVKLGLAIGGPERWIALEGDLQPGLDNRLAARETTWNARLGGRARLSRHVSIGGGLFTDRAPDHPAREFGTSRIDFYGATAGVQLATAHSLERRDDDPPRDLVFSTTIALRYAYGIGQVGGLRFDLDAPEESVVTDQPVDGDVHEFSLHLGSAIEF
jgi:hypothetical protein